MSNERRLRARHWARVAGRIALDHFREVEPEWKQGGSLVTAADREIEQLLRNRISEAFPDDAIVGEEQEARRPDRAAWTWYLDPIDGTAGFSMRLPIWAVSIGLEGPENRRDGVLRVPALDEEFYRRGSSGVFRNQDQLEPGWYPPSDWTSESLLCVTSDAHRQFRIDFPGKCRSLGSTAYHMAMVLDNRAVGAVLNRIHIWDVAAVWALGEEFGLRLETLSGEPLDRASLRGGERAPEPLLYGFEETITDLRGRVKRLGEE